MPWALLLVPLLAHPVRGSGTDEPFVERARDLGLDFEHFNGMSGELYFVEMVGGGGALFDYDRDGDLDVYLVQGHMLGEDKRLEDATFPPPPGPLVDRLYRNDLEIRPDGSRRLRFTDVTSGSELRSDGYGMGVTVGDIDNDGWPDLYVTNFGSNRLFRNDGDGTFTDVTAKSGTDDPRWSVSASFLDFDRDGWLDLYVGNYVDYRLATHKPCTSPTGRKDYCGPSAYSPQPDRLLRNRGDGTFEDVTSEAGTGSEYGGALGVTTGHFDGDDWIDLYVANDGLPNQLWLNQRDGTFRNEALLTGTAVNAEGMPEASMGVVAGDLDGDGLDDLFMSHLTRETNTVYLNQGEAMFRDLSRETGLGLPSFSATGFGIALFDYDNDGWLDLFVANGAVTRIEKQIRNGDPYPLHEKNQLFRNRGEGQFEEMSETAGPALALSEVSRGVAAGDVDNDGDADLLVVNNAGPARLLVNETGSRNRWIGLRLTGGEGTRDLLGTRVAVFPRGSAPLWRCVRTDGSYASAGDPRVLVGLGASAGGVRVRAIWPDGQTEEWHDLAPGRYHTLRRGTGTPVE